MKRALIAGGFVMAATAVATIPAHAQQDLDFPPLEFSLISGTLNTLGDIIVKEHWKDVEEETDGKVTVNMQSRDELGVDGAAVYRVTKLGVAQIGSTAMQFSAGEVPENDGVDVQGLLSDLDVGKEVADAWMPHLSKVYSERVGVHLLGVFPIVAQVIWCSVPIEGIDDLKGKKVRVSGPALADIIAGTGAVPTTIAFAEVVPSLQRKVIDCAVTGTTSGNLTKWTDVATHLYPLVTGWAFQGIYANQQWWDGLDPNARQFVEDKFDTVIDDAWKRAQEETAHGIWCSVGDDRCDVDIGIKQMTKTDLTLVPVSEEDQMELRRIAEREVLPDWAERCGQECAEAWNESVGKILGVQAVAP